MVVDKLYSSSIISKVYTKEYNGIVDLLSQWGGERMKLNVGEK